MAIYGIFESTNIRGKNFSMQSANDVENGTLVVRGDLITKDIYEAQLPATATLATAPVFVVGHPAWSYDTSSVVNQNENAFINKAGKAFRTYELAANDRFAIADYGIDFSDVGNAPAVGQFLGLANGSGTPVASATEPSGSAFVGKIVAIKDQGNAYFIGQDVNLRTKKIVIEVIQNGNAASSATANGFEVWTGRNPTAASTNLANAVYKQVNPLFQSSPERGIKKNNGNVNRMEYFGAIPCILTEHGFVGNSKDNHVFDSHLAAQARAIVDAFDDFFGVKTNTSTPSNSTATNSALLRVQVGAFSVKSNADNFQSELKKKGYETMLVFIGGLYKIQVGAYSIRANADAMLARLKSDGYNGFITGGTIT